jgi:hypothetical protein
MAEALIVVYEAPNGAMSQVVKDALEQAGVPVIERTDRTPYANDFAVNFSIFRGRYSCLLTLESRAEEARRLVADFLAAYERGDLALEDDTGEEERHECA